MAKSIFAPSPGNKPCPRHPPYKLHVLLNAEAYTALAVKQKIKRKNRKKRTTSAKGVWKYITSPVETSVTLTNNNNKKRVLDPRKEPCDMLEENVSAYNI